MEDRRDPYFRNRADRREPAAAASNRIDPKATGGEARTVNNFAALDSFRWNVIDDPGLTAAAEACDWTTREAIGRIRDSASAALTADGTTTRASALISQAWAMAGKDDPRDVAASGRQAQ